MKTNYLEDYVRQRTGAGLDELRRIIRRWIADGRISIKAPAVVDFGKAKAHLADVRFRERHKRNGKPTVPEITEAGR